MTILDSISCGQVHGALRPNGTRSGHASVSMWRPACKDERELWNEVQWKLRNMCEEKGRDERVLWWWDSFGDIQWLCISMANAIPTFKWAIIRVRAAIVVCRNHPRAEKGNYSVCLRALEWRWFGQRTTVHIVRHLSVQAQLKGEYCPVSNLVLCEMKHPKSTHFCQTPGLKARNEGASRVNDTDCNISFPKFVISAKVSD